MLKSPSKNISVWPSYGQKMTKTWDFCASMAITLPNVYIFGWTF
jgi:hypothetical protein